MGVLSSRGVGLVWGPDVDFGGTLGREKFDARYVPPIPLTPIIGLAGGLGLDPIAPLSISFI